MILSATFSVPTKQCNANLGRDYTKIKFTKNGENLTGNFLPRNKFSTQLTQLNSWKILYRNKWVPALKMDL